MRRSLSWILRGLREDDGLTAVEYAILTGVVVAVAGVAAFWLGQGVHNSSGRVAWSGATGSHAAAASPRLIASTPKTAFGSMLPWGLLSIGVTIAIAGAFFGWYYLRDFTRYGRTRRVVRHSLADATGQAVLGRLMPSAGSPNVRFKRPDTRLIGRNSPDLHHWLRSRNVDLSAEITDADVASRIPPDMMASITLSANSPTGPFVG